VKQIKPNWLTKSSLFSFKNEYRALHVILFLIAILSWFFYKAEINNIVEASKQFFGLYMYMICFYMLIRVNEDDIKRLLIIYLNIAFFIALIALIQEIGFLTKIKSLYDFSFFLNKWNPAFSSNFNIIKANSILPEPSAFCIAMIVSFFVSTNSLLTKNFELLPNFRLLSIPIPKRLVSLVIVIAYIASFSLIGYIGIFLTLIILLFNYVKDHKKAAVKVSALIALFLCLIFTFPELRIRICDTHEVFFKKKHVEFTNKSTATFFVNYEITKEVITKNVFGFLFGNGLGSYELSYKRYIDKFKVKTTRLSLENLNRKDANSLFLRLLAETGSFGLSAFLFLFMFKYWIIKNKGGMEYLWIMNNAIFIYFIMRLIRQGNYFTEGFLFFAWMYYFSKKTFMVRK
ncbi:hypothetical protein ACFL2Y_04270, partial [Candidatus Omnitrophota bacterium]